MRWWDAYCDRVLNAQEEPRSRAGAVVAVVLLFLAMAADFTLNGDRIDWRMAALTIAGLVAIGAYALFLDHAIVFFLAQRRGRDDPAEKDGRP